MIHDLRHSSVESNIKFVVIIWDIKLPLKIQHCATEHMP